MQTMVFVAVSVATIAFAFAQLGLVGLGEPNEGMTYAVVQLVPVAIAALLFGPLGGALLGLIVGAALVVFAFRGCVLYELSVNGALAGEFANVDESFGRCGPRSPSTRC